jgi:polyisoprenoid-binding protein YceI
MTARTKLLGGTALLATVLIAAFVLWFFVIRSDGPSAATSKDAVAAAKGQQPATSGPVKVDGQWKLSPKTPAALYPFDKASYVGYRVEEELGGIGANTAVGRTPEVAGSLNITGTQITAVAVTAQFETLQSDSDSRDENVRDEALETAKFPEASFTLTTPIELGAVPADGATITVNATGDLTLHGVTKTISFPLEATLVGNTIAVVGRAPVTYSDYNIDAPTSALVISIKDAGEIEFQLFFVR